jgi:dienelactone hydrolase
VTRLPAVGGALLGLALLASPLAAQVLDSFPAKDGGIVYADEYGSGGRGVVLVHGARFDRTSWKDQALRLQGAGLHVLAVDLRDHGLSHGPASTPPRVGYPLDVLAAVGYLRAHGAGSIALVGASMGGWAAGSAAIQAPAGAIQAMVLLAASPVREPEKLPGRKLFIVARGDTTGNGTHRLTWVREQYRRAPGPKKLVILEGSAHAQFLFGTDQGERLMSEMLRFLSEDGQAVTGYHPR